MFFNLTSLLVGFLCLLVVVLMLFNLKSNNKTNIYLVIILFIAGIQRFLNAIEALELTKLIYSPLKLRLSFGFFIVPIYYLFFKRLIKKNAILKIELLHFAFPSLLVLIDIFILGYGLSYYIYLIFSCCYFVAILLLVKGLINSKKRSIFDEANYKTIRTWTLLMTLITFSLVVFSNYFLFSETKTTIILNNFYRYSSILWLIAIIYIFKNPVILFGEQNLMKNIQSNELQEFLVWSKKPLMTLEEKDKIVYNNIINKIEFIILSIQKLQKSTTALTTFTFTADTLAKKLKLPRTHIELIFKYYCHYSVSDFSNLVKINYAVTLINEGYLNEYTVAHLGDVCLFNSRFTFSKNFKKFVGVSVSDYVINMPTSTKLNKYRKTV